MLPEAERVEAKRGMLKQWVAFADGMDGKNLIVAMSLPIVFDCQKDRHDALS